VVGAIGFDEFNGCMCFPWGIKVVSGVGMSWSLIVEVYVNFDMLWGIVLLSPEDLYELVVKCI